VDFVASKGGPRKANNILTEVKVTKDLVKEEFIIAKALKFLGSKAKKSGKPKRNGKDDNTPLGKLYHARAPQKLATGGPVGTDTVPALLTPGEFVINKKSAEAFGYGGLAKINKYAKGGPVGVKPSTISKIGAKRTISLSDKTDRITASYPNDASGGGEVTADLVKNSTSGKLYSVQSSRATKGLGPKLYDTVMESATRKGGSLISDRSRVSPSAYNVWSYYFNKRSDVSKKPLKSADWYFGDKYFDTQAFASEDPKTWPPTSDPAWTLQSGYSKKPSIIKDLKQTKRTGFALGGSVGTDTVPALLTPGEFVVNKQSAQAFGYGGLAKINKYAKGGVVGVQKFANGGEVGGSGGFDFITSASAEFGILLFSLNAIAKPLKQFQDNLTSGGGAIKAEIEARKLLRLKIAAAKEGFETLDLQKYQDAVDASAANLLTAKNKAFSDPGTGIESDAVASANAAGSSTFGAGVAPRSDKENAKSAVRLDTAIDSLSKKYGESGAVVEGLKNVINQYSGDLLAQSNAAKAYVASLDAANSQIEELTNAEKLAVNQSSKILRVKQKYEQELLSEIAELEKGTGSGDLKKSIENFGSSIVAAGSKLKKIALIEIPGPGALAAGARKGIGAVGERIGAGARAVGERIGAGARVGVEKVGAGIKRAGEAATNNPLAVVAGVAATLRTVLGGVSKTFSDVADQAIASGDAEEAASNAKLAAEFKAVNDFTTASVGAGAAIGSMFGPVGTIIGSFAGALLGALSTLKPFQDAIDVVIGYLNLLPGIDIETFAGSKEKKGKQAETAANRNKLEKEIDVIGTKFRNLGRDIDPKTNLAGFVSAADELAKVTNEQALSIKQDPALKEDGTVDKDEQARRLSENSKAAADAFSAASEAANAQGVSLQQLAQDSPELAKAFKESLPPGEAKSIWNQMIQVNQAAIAAIAAENAARINASRVFLEQISIQDRLNNSLSNFDQVLNNQQQKIASLDFVLSGNVSTGSVGSDLTDFKSSGTASFQRGLSEVSKLGPDFAKQANKISGVLANFNGFSNSLSSGDFDKASKDLRTKLTGILSNSEITKIEEEIETFSKDPNNKNNAAAAATLQEKLIQDAIGPFAETLEDGRQKINKSLDNYTSTLDKINQIERQRLESQIENVKQEQAITKQISELLELSTTASQAKGRSGQLANTALSGTRAAGSLSGNRAQDVAFLGKILNQNKLQQQNIAKDIESKKLNKKQVEQSTKTLKNLQLESEGLEKAMSFLSDTTEENAAIQQKLSQSRKERDAKREVATSLAFGTNESRSKFFDTFEAAKTVGSSGSAETIPENKRSDVLSLLKQFSSSRIFGGRTGKEAERAATGNYLASLPLSFDEINNTMDDFIAGELDMVGAIRENLRIDQDRNAILLSIQQNLARAAAPAPAALQFPANGGIIHASEGKLINFTPKGTDTVPAMLTPGEFVIKRSSVRKYGNKMMESINAGNFAGGGQIGDSIQRITKPQFFPVDFVKQKYQEYLSVPRNAGRETYPIGGGFFGGPEKTWAEFFRQLTGTRSEKQAKYTQETQKIYDQTFAKPYSKLLERGIGLKQGVGPNGEDQFGPGIVKGATIKNGKTIFQKENRIVPSEELVLFSANIKTMLAILDGSDFTQNGIADSLVYKNIDKIFGGRLTQDLTGLLESYNEIKAAFLALQNNDPLRQTFTRSNDDVLNRLGGLNPANLLLAPNAAIREEEFRKIGFNTGGPVYASTGKLVNYQPKGTDTVPAMLTPGEYVINKDSAEAIGTNNLNRLNSIKGYNKGGRVGYYGDGGNTSGRFGTTRRLDPVRNTQLVSSEENTTPKKSRLDESNSILEEFNKALSELSETSKALAAAKAAEASATNQRLSDFTEEALARGDNNAALKYATEQSKALLAQEEKASKAANARFGKAFAEGSSTVSAGDSRLTALTADQAGTNLLKTIVKTARDLATRNIRAQEGRVGEKSEIEKESVESILARAKEKSKNGNSISDNPAQRRGVVDVLSRGIPKQLPKAPTSLREDAEAERKARVASRLGAETGVTYGTGTSQTGVTYGTGPSRAAKFGPVTREEEATFQEQKAISKQKRAITTAELKATGGDFEMRNVGTENSPRYEEAFLGFKGPEAEEDRKLFRQKSFEAAVAGGYGYANNRGLMNLKTKSEIEQSKADREEELLKFMKKNPKLSRKRASARLSRFNTGGLVSGIPGIDTNPAMLTRGEYVINKKSAEAIGINNLNRLNSARGYNKGGRVGYYADGGSVGGLGNSSESYTMFSNSVDKLVANNGFAMFKESVDQFNSIPKELTLTVAPTQVTVTLNGAELLSRMTPMIKSQIFEGITSEINKLKEDLKSGNIV
jgi:hypothetical protein